MISDDEKWMVLALQQAQQAAVRGEVPVGAVIVGQEGLITAAGNNPIAANDPTAHAEIIALRQAAAATGNYRLVNTTMYVTLEPCIMCMGAMVHARVERLVYGATDPKTGAAHSLYQLGSDQRLNHTIKIESGILAEECSQLLRWFFAARRRR